MNRNDTSTHDGNIPHVRDSGNPAKESPKKIRRQDAEYIENKLRKTFVRGDCMDVHRSHMDVARGNAKKNMVRRKIP